MEEKQMNQHNKEKQNDDNCLTEREMEDVFEHETIQGKTSDQRKQLSWKLAMKKIYLLAGGSTSPQASHVNRFTAVSVCTVITLSDSKFKSIIDFKHYGMILY